MTNSAPSQKRRRKRVGTLLTLACALVAGTWWMAMDEQVPDRERVPGRSWSRISPEEAGFDPQALDAITEPVGGAGCLIQHGRLVYEWGDSVIRNDIASSVKPFYTFWVLQAVQNGILQSLDDRVVDWVPEIADLNEELGFKNREITFRHLLEQVSGYGLTEKPGEAFAYNDAGSGLLAWTVMYRLFKLAPERADTLLNGEGLGQVIGFEDQPTLLYPNTKYGRVRISTRDLARFGLLFLRGGQWGDTEVLREDMVAQALREPRSLPLPRTSGVEVPCLRRIPTFGGGRNLKGSLGCLGYYWWFNHETPDGSLLLPAAPPDTFMGMGFGGRYCFILIPELDIEIVWIDIYGKEQWSPFDRVGRFHVNDLLQKFLQARTLPDSVATRLERMD